MKHIFYTAIISFITFGATAQHQSDTTRFSIGTKKIIILDTTPPTDSTSSSDSTKNQIKKGVRFTFGLDAGVNILRNTSGNLSMDSTASWLDLNYSRSLSWRMQVLAADFPIYQNFIKIKSGLGFAWNGYGLKNNVRPTTMDSTGIYAITIPDSISVLTKNKFRHSYLTLPLMIELNTNNDLDKAFHLSAGVIGGWNMGSMVKQKWHSNDSNSAFKHKGIYNANPFTLDATARIGYGKFTLFGTYGLTTLFEKNKGPEVYPITIGLQIIGW